MAAVIYSSHGSYLAPADLMGGTGGRGGVRGEEKVTIETLGTCPSSLMQMFKPDGFYGKVIVLYLSLRYVCAIVCVCVS